MPNKNKEEKKPTTTKAQTKKTKSTTTKSTKTETKKTATKKAQVKTPQVSKNKAASNKIKVNKTKVKTPSASPKKVSQTLTTKKTNSKAKPVVVEVISDKTDLISAESFISDASLSKSISKKSSNQKVSEIITQDDSLIEEDFFNSLEEKIELDRPSEDLDRQKQFFSDLVSDLKDNKNQEIDDLLENTTTTNSIKSTKNLRLYRRLVWNFLLLVGFLVIIVAYFSFTKLTIYITPQIEAMNDVLFLRVEDFSNEISENNLGDARELINGHVQEIELRAEKTYLATGERYLDEEIVGRVNIINKNNKDQVLVATTRLLSPDGKLFRIKEGVTVPSGSQVSVDIYADKVSPEMAINPTHFIIPGLWVGLQDKIYAESKESFKYERRIEKYIQASDLQLANNEAANLLLNKAKELEVFQIGDKLIHQISEPITIDLKAKAGDKQDKFTIIVKAKVITVSFSEEEVMRIARTKFNLLMPDDKELLEIKPDSFIYNLETIKPEEKSALVKVNHIGLMTLKSNAEIIDKANLKQLSADQINKYLKNFPEIGDYELEFKPAFIKKAPYLVDRIKIKIKAN